MTSPAFVTAADVRGYLDVTGTTGNYSDGAIGSNIRAASEYLERATNRWFADKGAVTFTATSQGQTSLWVPGFRSVSGVTSQGTALTADETYFLIPDQLGTGIYTAIQFRGFGSRSFGHRWLSNPEWFDRGLDLPDWNRGGWSYSPANDIVVSGSGGYADADLPEAVRHATKVLAAFYTKRPDSVLASVATTVEGTTLDYSALPPEVATFVELWHLSGPQAVSVG